MAEFKTLLSREGRTELVIGGYVFKKKGVSL